MTCTDYIFEWSLEDPKPFEWMSQLFVIGKLREILTWTPSMQIQTEHLGPVYVVFYFQFSAFYKSKNEIMNPTKKICSQFIISIWLPIYHRYDFLSSLFNQNHIAFKTKNWRWYK